jgi:hypothetical protein
MIFLKLQGNKILKANQSASVFQGENNADIIKVNLADTFVYDDWTCYLHILAEGSQTGDMMRINDNDEIALDGKFLTEEQELTVWFEMRKDATIMKSSEVKIKVNKHHNIEEVIQDVEITAFEQVVQEAAALYEQTIQVKTEIESLIGSVGNLPNIEEINEKLKELDDLKIQLEESLTKLEAIPTKMSDLINDTGYITAEAIPTKLSSFDNDAGYITEANIPTKISDLENDANYLSPDNLTPEIVEELKASLDQAVVSF